MAQDSIPVAPANIPNGSAPHPIMSIGGEEKHTLILDEMPSHSHNYYFGGGNGGEGGPKDGWRGSNHAFAPSTNAAGGSKPHNIMPSFYTLVYIMKL